MNQRTEEQFEDAAELRGWLAHALDTSGFLRARGTTSEHLVARFLNALATAPEAVKAQMRKVVAPPPEGPVATAQASQPVEPPLPDDDRKEAAAAFRKFVDEANFNGAPRSKRLARVYYACADWLERGPTYPGPAMEKPGERLGAIAAIIEQVDTRCMATDGPVTPTLKEMTPDELARIYALARGHDEGWRP